MSKYTLKKEILKEIKNINTLIDMRIIKGISYKDLSRRHKFLISELNSLALKQYSYMKNPRPPIMSPNTFIKTPAKASNINIIGFFKLLGRFASISIF